jgi:hypothetical protein
MQRGLRIERRPFHFNAWLGPLGLVIDHYPSGCGWAIHKWRYYSRSSWRHGSAYLGRWKIMW